MSGATVIMPAMVRAAWIEARRWWPRKVAEVVACKACGRPKAFVVTETAILVDEPMPGFREAIEAALRAGEAR